MTGEPTSGLRRLSAGLGSALALGLVALAVCVEPVQIGGIGMVPALLAGDLAVARRAWTGAPELGDVVVFVDQGVRYPARVVATGGQRVEMANGVLLVDGQAMSGGGERRTQAVPMGRCGERSASLQAEVYDGAEVWVQAHGDHAEELVADGQFFLLGDYRREASDSRHWGSVPPDRLAGVVLGVLWSTDPCDGGLRPGRRFDFHDL